jgi:hypothetical protein
VHRIADLFEDLFGEGFELPRNALPTAAVDRLDRLVRTGTTVILPTGEVLGGRFKISELVGVGTSGLVYTAADQRGGWKTVAVKTFHPGFGESVRPRLEEAVRRLEGEHHPSVTRVIAMGDHAGQLFVVTEHIPTTLAQALEDGAVGLADAFTLFDGIIDGLVFLHRAGLAHGDLRPSNVLLRMRIGHTPEPVITDWAQLGDADDGFGAETLFHMPPEQVDDPVPAPSHDVYAAGVLLFQLLSGRHPFDLTVATKLLQKYLAAARAMAAQKRLIMLEFLADGDDPPPETGGAKVLAAAYHEMIAAIPRLALPRRAGLRNVASTDLILRKAMHVDPKQRYVSVEHIREDLLRNKADQPLEGGVEPPLVRARKLAVRHRHRVPALAGAAALVLAVIGVLSVRAGMPGQVAVEVPDWVREMTLRVDGTEVPAHQLGEHLFGPGILSVEVVTEGWSLEQTTIDVPARGEARLVLVRQLGQAALTTDPPGAAFVVARGPLDPGSKELVTPFSGRLPTGRYEGTLVAQGYLSEALVIEVRADAPVVVERTLREVVEVRVPIPGVVRVAALRGPDGRPARLLVSTLSGGRGVLELRDPTDGRLLSSVEVPAAPGAVLYADVNGDGTADLAYGDGRGRLVVRRGPSFASTLWEAPGAGGLQAPVRVDGSLISVSEDGVVRAFSAASGARRWVQELGAGARAGGPIAAHAGTLFIPGADAAVHALSLVDGATVWTADRTAPLVSAVSWLELDGGKGGVLVGDRDGGFALIDADAGIPVRMGRSESIAPGAVIPTWHDGGAWQRLRISADGEARVEDLRGGVSSTLLGTFAGPIRWADVRTTADGAHLALLAFEDGLHVVRFEAGARRGAELAVLTADVGPSPLVYAIGAAGTLRVAWLSGGELLFATLTTVEQGETVAFPPTPAGAVRLLP